LAFHQTLIGLKFKRIVLFQHGALFTCVSSTQPPLRWKRVQEVIAERKHSRQVRAPPTWSTRSRVQQKARWWRQTVQGGVLGEFFAAFTSQMMRKEM